MAQARISYTWASGEELDVEVCVESDYPDAVAEAQAQAWRLFHAGWAEMTSEAES